MLRLLGGLTPPSSGDIRFRGDPVSGPPDGVVVVFQDYSRALLQWRTVAANVALGLEGRLDGSALKERVERALQMVGLERCAGDQPWQLSGGMQQRVQIARALALQPDVVMMDEPFGALDAMTKATLQDELVKVHARTGTGLSRRPCRGPGRVSGPDPQDRFNRVAAATRPDLDAPVG